MKNPYTRLRELCGLTQKAFCERNDFGKMTMVYLEAGIYTSVSDRQNIALGRECANRGIDARAILNEEFGTESLAVAYSKWRTAERKNIDTTNYPTEHRAVGEQSPMEVFARTVAGSIQRFCKTLKVQPATLNRYMRGQTISMPKELSQAFEEMGFDCTKLCEAQAQWVQEQL
jgi:DNA-binding XRE family transcriptional regulator